MRIFSLCLFLKTLAILLLCWSLSFTTQARQRKKEKEKSAAPAQTYRSELASNSFDNEHHVQALPDSALLLVSMKRNAWFGKNDFVLTKYDRQLKPVWETKYEHLPNTGLLFIAAERGTIYLLFSTLTSQRLLLYQVNANTGLGKASEHTLPSPDILFKEMAALNGQVFLSGVNKFTLNMLHLNPQHEEIKLLPAVFGTEKDLGEFRVDTLSKAVEFVTAAANGQRTQVQVKRMNSDGDVTGTYFIQPDLNSRANNTLQPARLTPGDTLNKLLVGTYGYRTDKYANGLFISTLAGQIAYYDLYKLSRFFEYLSPRGERRMKAKLARKAEKERAMVMEHQVLLHPIMPHPQGFALVGEVYYPHYSMIKGEYVKESGRTPDFNDRKVRLDGYQFTHAIACVFDHEGKLLWDNTYKLQNLTYSTLDPTLKAGVSPAGNITLVYQEKDFVWHKTLKPNLSITNKEKTLVRLQEKTEKMVTSSNEGIVHWYGGNFVAFGFQRIKPQHGSARTVFYLQNMVF
ncbi:hypothetical protein [Rufibacter hautae]|uniref:Uncharacterized protein n=1 Tax=Rufibacter hautae TaxID=2595005 RepID=A0A5B6TBB2_9BACT|nr:hypothetical protein [Rufibacter hautae]KAA3436423.1 hypothetical protein FOA19_18695 [Rufibacter hautae]